MELFSSVGFKFLLHCITSNMADRNILAHGLKEFSACGVRKVQDSSDPICGSGNRVAVHAATYQEAERVVPDTGSGITFYSLPLVT